MAYSNRGYSMPYQQPQKQYGGYAPRQSRGGYGSARQVKKHSGAKFYESTKNGNPVICAWNYSRRMGLVKILIAPYKGSKTVTSKAGRKWAVWMCKIEGPGFAENFPVLVDFSKRMAIIRKYGWAVKCSAPNGGYCGTFTK